MKQLRRLSEVTLQKQIKAKQPNGTLINTYESIGNYEVIEQEMTEQIDATIYGANLIKMLRLSSVQSTLEKYLQSKNDDTPDNLSLYYILIGKKRYKIKAVYKNWIDIEFYETHRTI